MLCETRPAASEDRLARWKELWSGRPGTDPGFHHKETTMFLEKHFQRFVGDASASSDGAGPAVLVPLCGKSVDMLYFGQHGLRVVGVEAIGRAPIDFRDEHRCIKDGHMYEPFETRPVCLKGFKMPKNLSLSTDGWTLSSGFEASAEFLGEREGFVFKKGNKGIGYYTDAPRIWRGTMVRRKEDDLPIDIIQGDFLSVTPELIDAATSVQGGTFELIYDRGAFEAVPLAARRTYVERLSSLLRPGGRILMVAKEYKQPKVAPDPSPFSVSMKDLQALFPKHSWQIDDLDSQPHDACEKLVSFKGVDVKSRVFLITKRESCVGLGTSSGSTVPLGMAALVALGGVGAMSFFCKLSASRPQ